MKTIVEKKEILDPKNQLILHGYNYYFNKFNDLLSNKKLPSVMLISGNKGIGKATFIYHFVNYILSKNEDHPYNFDKKSIDYKNKSYNLLNSGIYNNFYILEKNLNFKNISVDEVRLLSSFLNKTSLQNKIKIILVDSVEDLNINSSNAFLKILEDVNNNTFFFLLTNNSTKVLPTVKSRSIEFKIFFNFKEKKEIFLNLINNYNLEVQSDDIFNFLNFDTPGNLINYYSFLDTDDKNNNIKNISFFINKYLKEKNLRDLNLISLFIEKFYNDLVKDSSFSNFKIFYNRLNILNRLNMMKKFNLDAKDTFFYIENTLNNDQR